MKKVFDCVQMKWDIQQKLMEEYDGFSLEARKTLMAKKRAENPSLTQWLREIRGTYQEQSKVVEERAEYGAK